MNKRRVAKECLLFLGGLAFGLLIQWPIFISMLDPFKNGFVKSYAGMVAWLFGSEGPLAAIFLWVFTLAVYIVFQIGRSVLWALKTTKS